MNSYFKSILKISIPSDYILDITLLSSREAKGLPKRFLPASSTSKINWWLRTAGARGRVAFVDGDGDIDIEGQNVYYDYGVRPALVLSKSYINKLELGDIVVCLKYAWIYAGKHHETGKDLLLFLTVLDHHCFNADIEKPGANFFVGSDIQKYLRKWLKEAKESYDRKKYSAYSSMTQKYIFSSNDFKELKKAIKTHLENEEEDAVNDDILILDNETGKYKII